jgi:hypothetical protein
MWKERRAKRKKTLEIGADAWPEADRNMEGTGTPRRIGEFMKGEYEKH